MLTKILEAFKKPSSRETDMATKTVEAPTGAGSCMERSKKSCGETAGQLSATSCCEQQLCETAVRERAYYLWEEAGYPEGDGADFWYQAEELLRTEAE